jgi:hypothetical protein
MVGFPLPVKESIEMKCSYKIQPYTNKIFFRLKRIVLKQICSGSVLDTSL